MEDTRNAIQTKTKQVMSPSPVKFIQTVLMKVLCLEWPTELGLCKQTTVSTITNGVSSRLNRFFD